MFNDYVPVTLQSCKIVSLVPFFELSKEGHEGADLIHRDSQESWSRRVESRGCGEFSGIVYGRKVQSRIANMGSHLDY